MHRACRISAVVLVRQAESTSPGLVEASRAWGAAVGQRRPQGSGAIAIK